MNRGSVPHRAYDVELRVDDPTITLPGSRRHLAKFGGDVDLRPIIVTSVGRSGSTLLMQELKDSPQVVAATLPPYEIKLLAYYASAFRTLVADADRVRSTNPTSMFVQTDRFRIGHNPWKGHSYYELAKGRQLEDLFERTIPNRFLQMFRATVWDYYDILRRDQGKPEAAWFAEKGEIYEDARYGSRLLFPAAKEVVLLRDPRDLLCSSIQFWRLSPDEALEMLKTTLPELDAAVNTADGSVHCVHYEDLILDPVHTRQALSAFLDIELATGPGSEALSGHVTSASAATSVGRWKADLSPALAAACEDAFGEFMERHGYSAQNGSRPGPSRLALFGGSQAIARRDEEHISCGPSETVMQLVATWTVERGTLDRTLLGEGWSDPEDTFVWTVAKRATLHIPHATRPGGAQTGGMMLRLDGRAYTHAEFHPKQRLTLRVAGQTIGDVTLTERSVIEVRVPFQPARSPMITVTIALPDAARPSETVPGDTDNRLLGFSLSEVSLFVEAPGEEQPRDVSPVI